MRIIDEKGRLFGRINVIDLLAIIFLLSLIPVFYFGYKIHAKKAIPVAVETKPASETPKVEAAPVPKKNIIETVFDFDLQNLDSDTVGAIAVGDKEIDKSGQIIGEILALKEFEPQSYVINMGSVRKVLNDPLRKHVMASLRIKAEVQGDALYYKNKRVLQHSAIDFTTDKYTVEALYLPLGPEQIPKSDILATQYQIDELSKNIGLILDDMAGLNTRMRRFEGSMRALELNKIPGDEKKR